MENVFFFFFPFPFPFPFGIKLQYSTLGVVPYILLLRFSHVIT